MLRCSWLVGLLLGVSSAQVANPRVATSTTLSVLPGMAVAAGTVVTLQATVDADSVVTAGSVTFLDGNVAFAAVQVVSGGEVFPVGTGNLKVVLGPGSHQVSASYRGTGDFLSSTSGSTSISVAMPSAVGTGTVLTWSGNAGNYTLQGRVTVLSTIVPTGMVSFVDQSHAGYVLGTAALDAGSVTRAWEGFAASTAGGSNYGVVTGDLNNDGIPDLVTSNYGNNTISVFLGNGDGTFQPRMDYDAGELPFGMALGDVNGDGIPDLAVASHNSSVVSLLLGNGDGTFQVAQSLTTGGVSHYVVMGDFNGDGFLDLAACSSGNGSVSVLLGNGDGTFQKEQSYGDAGSPYGLAVGDFNQDGVLDLAVSDNGDGVVGILLGNGDGTFQSEVDYTTVANPATLAVGDLNEDSHLDLVVGTTSGSSLSVLLGNGDGTLQPKVDYSGLSGPWGVALADVNGDGILDVVATSPSTQKIGWFQGNGDGTLMTPVITSTAASNYLIAVGDLNGDGALDVAVPNLAAANVKVALGTVSATATLAGVSVPGGGAHSVVARYGGDANFAASTSPVLILVGTPFATGLMMSAVPTLATPGQAIVLAAEVAPWSGSGYTAGGTVTFLEGESPIGAVSLVNGAATLSKSDFANGMHNITAEYSGDTNFVASNTESASTITVAQAQTITFGGLSAVTYGAAPLALTASASSGLPVAFSVVSGPGTVSGSALTITGAGSVVVEADQTGNVNYQRAAPVQQTLVVNPAASVLTLRASAADVAPGKSVTLTATVASGNLPLPTGNAVFLDGATVLGTAAFNGGVAALSTSALVIGVHSISASFAGDRNFLGSIAAAVTETVAVPDYSIAANPDVLSVKRGTAGTSVLTVTPVGGFAGQVSFSCSGLPEFASCSFAPASVSLADDVVRTVRFSLNAGAAGGASGFLLPIGVLALVGLARRRMRMVVVLALMFGVVGCGGSGHEVALGTSTVTMMAASGGERHSAEIVVTITP